LPANTNIAERTIAARLRRSTQLYIDEQLAVKNALRSLQVLLAETRAVPQLEDITEQDPAQQGQATSGGRLLQAQQQERRRIARNLHDDVVERLILLSLELEQTKELLHSDAEVQSGSTGLRNQASEIFSIVQSLVHEVCIRLN